jgi:hypothetical protein
MNDRPTYETTTDRQHEKRIAEIISDLWFCHVRKLPVAYRLDYAASRAGEVLAWIEIKKRNCTIDQYPDVFLSLQKVIAANQLHSVSERPCMFVVEFNDALAYARIVKPGRKIMVRGRTDRNDWQDVEPIVLIPRDEFTQLTRMEGEDGRRSGAA